MQKSILILFIAVAVLVAVFFNDQQPEQTTQQQDWHPVTTANRASLQSIEIVKNGETVIHAELQDGQWIMRNAANFPIDMSKLSAWYQSLIDSEVIENKTAKSENYAKLGLAESATKIKLNFKQDKSETLYLGRQTSAGLYVRRDGEPQSWLIDTAIGRPNDANDWLETQLIKDMDIFTTLTVKQAEQSWQAVKQEGEWLLADFDQNNESYASTPTLASYARSLKNLSFEQVAPYQKTLFDEAAFEISLTKPESNSTVLSFVQQENDWWLHISTEAYNHWQFKISDWSAEQLNKTRVDFIEDDAESTDSEGGESVD
ncbi:DUF4340 domain-containing protein [Gayadomonas joobiniege]|uniref:DUF4340 domain-containing protein n=1 Tax=Gayadomonas joobiniege TaxID=1234606 RepID=UPI000375011F|nr:DUF4340 domain-containing protein [Gayadomonas joobiniege]